MHGRKYGRISGTREDMMFIVKTKQGREWIDTLFKAETRKKAELLLDIAWRTFPDGNFKLVYRRAENEVKKAA